MSKILLIYAHPDDESFGCGGTIAKYVDQGAEIVLVCATRGEAGKCGEPPVCTSEELPKVREKELLAAAQVLGISKVIFLDYLDAQLFKVNEEEVVGRLIDIINEEKPEVVITFGPDGVSGHKDHIAVSSWATKAFFEADYRPSKLYYNTVSPKFMAIIKNGDLDAITPLTTKIDVSDYIENKIKAIQCHRSQNMSLGKILSIPEEQRKRFLSKEGFHRAYPPLEQDNIIEENILE